MAERLYLFDTTLRDGQQTSGVDFSLADKIRIAEALDNLGLDYIEGGYPGANPTDSQFFAEDRKLASAVMTAFGMTKRAGRSADNDPGFMEVLNAQAGAVCLVAKSWDYHVDVALGISNDENLASICDSVAAVGQHGREAMIDCEHFFDGYKANRDYALACATAALKPAPAGWCCATPMAAPCRMKFLKSCRMSPNIFPATILVFIRIMTRKMRSQIRLRRCRRVCASYRAQLTVWANAAAMPIWCRLFRPSCSSPLCRQF